jgi:hypothetical protein
MQSFLPTESEQSFMAHFSYETFRHPNDSPAVDWLNSHGIHWNVLAGFQRWQMMNDSGFMDKIKHPETLPPFQIPWETPSDLFKRVKDSLVAYPDLRPLLKGLMC